MSEEHAELQILRAVKDLLEQSPDVVENVYLNRTSAFSEAEELPAVVLHYGEEEGQVLSTTRLDAAMQLITEIVVQVRDDDGVALSGIRARLQARLMTNRKLGLDGMVVDTTPGGAEEPDIDDEGPVTVVRRRVTWNVHYTTDLTDPTRLS